MLLPLTAEILASHARVSRINESAVYCFKFIVEVNDNKTWKSVLISPVTTVWQLLGTTLIRCQLFGWGLELGQSKSFLARQGLIQREKVHIDCEKGAQISILANNIAIQ